MYKGKTDSSARGKSGVRYEWNADDEIDAPKGELDHLSNVEWVSQKLEKPNSQNRKDEIKAYLDQEDIDYDDDMLKDELLDLIQ